MSAPDGQGQEGTGLGLALVRRFVELHGGRLALESAIGQGSRFTCTLPVRHTSLAEAVSEGVYPIQSKTEIDSPLALVVEDEPQAAELLSQEGFQISKASGGEEGIAAARRDTPALIILDLLMPELDGFAVVERLRADPATATIPIIILTSKHLTPDEKLRLNGEIACLARKGEFSRGVFLELVRSILPPPKLRPPIAADEA